MEFSYFAYNPKSGQHFYFKCHFDDHWMTYLLVANDAHIIRTEKLAWIQQQNGRKQIELITAELWLIRKAE